MKYPERSTGGEKKEMMSAPLKPARVLLEYGAQQKTIGGCDNESKCGAWCDPYKHGYGKSEDGCCGGNNILTKRSKGGKTHGTTSTVMKTKSVKKVKTVNS